MSNVGLPIIQYVSHQKLLMFDLRPQRKCTTNLAINITCFFKFSFCFVREFLPCFPWYTSFEPFFFFTCLLMFLYFLIFRKRDLYLYIIRTVIKFYVNLFKIVILQNTSGNYNLSNFSLFTQGLLACGT